MPRKVLKELLRRQKSAEYRFARACAFQKEEAEIMAYLEHKTETSIYVEYDGYYRTEANPGKRFYSFVPVMHKYDKVRRWLNSYDEMHAKHQEAYAKEICRRGVTKEIEMAYICNFGGYYWETGCENVLMSLHRHGHKFSAEARELMKLRCPRTYERICEGK